MTADFQAFWLKIEIVGLLVVLAGLFLLIWCAPTWLEWAVKNFYRSRYQQVGFADTVPATGLVCPYCKNTVLMEEYLVSCTECKTLHHWECWISQKQCSVFGCNGTVEKLI
jgi:hypothetical protein